VAGRARRLRGSCPKYFLLGKLIRYRLEDIEAFERKLFRSIDEAHAAKAAAARAPWLPSIKTASAALKILQLRAHVRVCIGRLKRG
jgi:hypothetical protein